MLFTLLLALNILCVASYIAYLYLRKTKRLYLSIAIRVLFISLFIMTAMGLHTTDLEFLLMLCIWVLFEAVNMKYRV